jgi:hypothetical protein
MEATEEEEKNKTVLYNEKYLPPKLDIFISSYIQI